MDNKPLKFLLKFIAVLLLTAAIGFLAMKYINLQKELQADKDILKIRQINEKILSFAGLFIKDVLRAENEVDFETRLKLENAVRDIGDEEIVVQWQKFIGSKTESEAQEEVKNLLDLLVKKIRIK